MMSNVIFFYNRRIKMRVDPEHSRTLFLANSAAAVLHAGLALSGAVSTIDRGAVRVPVFDHPANWNVTRCGAEYGDDVPVCPSKEIDQTGWVNFSAVLIISQLITCGFHVMQAWQARSTDSAYIRWSLRKGIKVWHWVEYIATAPLIAHVVLYYSGMLGLKTQLLGYSSQATLMLVGLLQDCLRHGATQGLLDVGLAKLLIVISFAVGFFNLGTVWGPSLYALFIDSAGADPPAFVRWVVLSESLLYSSFGISQLAFFAPFLILDTTAYVERFLSEELVLIALSFVSKAVLASAFSVCLVYRVCGD
jgi:hypothetical protein